MLLIDAYNLFIMDKQSFCSEKSVSYYEENLGKFFRFLAEQSGSIPDLIDCDFISRKIVLQYFSFLRSTGVKNTTVNTYFRAVKTFLNYCIDEGYVVPDCLRKVKFLKSDQQPIIPLTQDEVNDIDKTFNVKCETGLRNYCIVHLMLDCGFRVSDVCNLRVKDVLFDKGIIMVLGKGDKYRSVLLPPCIKKPLYKYLVSYRPYVLHNGEYNEQPFFVQIVNRDFINENVVKQYFARLKKSSGVSRLYPHLCRHTFATSYIVGGGNIEFLRLMLGHSDYATTKMYLHLANQMMMLHSDVYKLDPVFFKNGY